MKDLKKEYEELILPEIPDLWDRIEAALPVEEASAPVEEEITAPVDTTTKSNVRTFNKTKIYRWSTVAAACLCACIVIPIALKDVNGCGSKSETASFDNAPAAMDCAPEYEMADGAVAEEPAEDFYSYGEVMEEAACEETDLSSGSASNSANDWGDDTLNIWDAESLDSVPSKGATSTSDESVSVFEVTAQIESEVITDGVVTGYSLLITEDLSDSLDTDRIVGYFSEEFANRLDEYDIVPKKEYVVQLRLNEEEQLFEIVELQ